MNVCHCYQQYWESCYMCTGIMELSHKERVSLLLGMTQGLRHSPVQFCMLPGEWEDSNISCYGPQAFLISGEIAMYFSISVSKLEKKQEQSSMEKTCNTKSCNSKHYFWLLAPYVLFCCINLSVIWSLQGQELTNSIPVLASDLCGISWPAVFCSSFKGFTLHWVNLRSLPACMWLQVLYFTRRGSPNAFTSRL